MCLLQFEALRYTTLIVIIIFAIFNILDGSVAIVTLCNGQQNIRTALIVSIVMNTLINIPLVTGINGTYRNNTLKLKRFIVAMMMYFFVKILLRKFVDPLETSNNELSIQIWYELCIIFSGLCFVLAIPLWVKVSEKCNLSEIQV
ncbi:uncharacterized protein LOC111593209 [Drosophila hydei]|uniref:Uncharacterized protein LOC111593209 n=1 Tax=Drosophila hydei TaxID=7224 RepID=A0A6J1L700_DROHY|nr:uncharacterized protein LOC111593209 [Drosophila hydei]